jgi:ribosomal protein S25
MKVSNPLTIIAVFSGLAEGLATVSLIKLPLELQEKFIYFVMTFPTLLVFLFFGVLIFKPKVLYAPSDFDNEDNYLKANNIEEVVKSKMRTEMQGVVGEVHASDEEKQNLRTAIDTAVEDSFKSARRDQIQKYLDAKYSATTQEICNSTGIHPSYASLILNNLVDEGVLTKDKKGREVVWALNL